MRFTNTGSNDESPTVNGVTPIHDHNRITSWTRAFDGKVFPVVKGNILSAYLLAVKPVKLPVKLIIDTRERLPLWPLPQSKLSVGDYTTEKLLNKFHIERKSLEDLCNTITGGHDRFKREMGRAKTNKTKLVIFVEGRYEDFIIKNFRDGEKRKIEGETLGKIIRRISKNHKIEVTWHDSREHMQKSVLKRLLAEEKKRR